MSPGATSSSRSISTDGKSSSVKLRSRDAESTASARSRSRLRRYCSNCAKSVADSDTTYEFGTKVFESEIVWCASIVRMRRLAIWTGWSFAPNRRALQPSIIRLTKDSRRSNLSPLQLYHFRTDEDDDGSHVDPGEHDRREGDRSVCGEDTETAG